MPNKLPILLIAFKRPQTTRLVLEEIKKFRPEKLYVAFDAPRNEEEKMLCSQTKALFNKLEWDCELSILEANENMGCRKRVSSAIDWFFEQVEEGIILEDDTLVSPRFFTFCKEMLERYRNNEQIMHITGQNLQFGKKRGDASYYFSNYAHIWGWASWRRAWKKYDVSLPAFETEGRHIIESVFKQKNQQDFWYDIISRCHQNQIDTWDYQWNYAIWKHQGLAIIPNVNMVKNIGIDAGATHMVKDEIGFHRIPMKNISTIKHPEAIVLNKEADDFTFEKVYQKFSGVEKMPSLYDKVKGFINYRLGICRK